MIGMRSNRRDNIKKQTVAGAGAEDGRPAPAVRGEPGIRLIATKVQMPPLKAKMLPRTHLLNCLSEGRDHRLVVVSGLAGSGKTSLVSRWLKESGSFVAWYSLDAMDNESDLFFRYLLAAVTGADERISTSTGPWPQSQKKLTANETVAFLVELLSGISQDVYIVLDDYHLIKSQDIHDTLSYLLEFIPENVHVVIVSRHAIPIPLNHFRVRNQIVEISASDMQFTEEETGRFFKEIMPLQLSPDAVRDLARYTEGWVGGLQLLGLSLKDKQVLPEHVNILSMAREEAAGYLVEEVVDAQPEAIRAFLEMTASLGRFNIELARDITGMADPSAIINYLYRNNLFLISLDADRVWYRYHQLFSDVIRKKIMVSSPELHRDVQRKAALWFALRGYQEDAFQHAFSSEDLDFAADLLEDYLLQCSERWGTMAGLRYILKVPVATLNQRPLLRLHLCAQMVENMEIMGAMRILRDLETDLSGVFARYQGPKRTLCQDLFTYYSNMVRHYHQDPERADIKHLHKACEIISSENRQFAGYMKMFIAQSHLAMGSPIKAAETLREAFEIIFGTESVLGKVIWCRLSAIVESIQGRLGHSEETLQKALEMLKHMGLADGPFRLPLLLPMAWNRYLRNDLKGAGECVAETLQRGQRPEYLKDTFEGELLTSLICMAEGNLDGAERSLSETLHVPGVYNSASTKALIDAWYIRLSMLRGDLRAARAWAEQKEFPFKEPCSFAQVNEFVILAEVWYWLGHFRRSADILKRLRVLCANNHLGLAVLDIDLLYSAALYNLNDFKGAQDAMHRALAVADREGIVRPFINHGSMISPVLRDMVSTIGTQWISSRLKALLNALEIPVKTKPAEGRVPADDNRRLTAREIEILELLADGHKYAEVADRAFVSLNTVRSHVRTIFKKLGVKTTEQAVREFRKPRWMTDR